MRAIAISLVLFLAPAAHGAIFGWTDSEGTAHYTNKESNIPPRYRAIATLVCPEPGDGQRTPQAGQEQAAPPSTARSEKPPAWVVPAVADPKPQNAMGEPVGKKRIPRHRQLRQLRASTEED